MNCIASRDKLYPRKYFNIIATSEHFNLYLWTSKIFLRSRIL